MKSRILLSAAIGAGFVGVFYPTGDVATRVIAIAVAFFVLLGILFCTMLIGTQDEVRKRGKDDRPLAPGQNKSGGGASVEGTMGSVVRGSGPDASPQAHGGGDPPI